MTRRERIKFTAKQHSSMSEAAQILSTVYREVGDINLHRQWKEVALVHHKAAMLLLRNDVKISETSQDNLQEGK